MFLEQPARDRGDGFAAARLRTKPSGSDSGPSANALLDRADAKIERLLDAYTDGALNLAEYKARREAMSDEERRSVVTQMLQQVRINRDKTVVLVASCKIGVCAPRVALHIGCSTTRVARAVTPRASCERDVTAG